MHLQNYLVFFTLLSANPGDIKSKYCALTALILNRNRTERNSLTNSFSPSLANKLKKADDDCGVELTCSTGFSWSCSANPGIGSRGRGSPVRFYLYIP